ncbi:MAG: transcriptional repressor LexA [Rhodospirillaceae bacterium]|nr:transcriptional repressor LexA [Rhodospirillaceae bacterium]
MLTRKQHELLVYINDRIAESGVSPSFDEMKDALNLRSKSGIHRLITGLEERGFLRRLPHRARALEVVRMPETAAVGTSPGTPARNNKFLPSVIDGGRSGLPAGRPVEAANDTAALPLYGKIAAGTPIEALSDTSHTVEVPPSMLGRGEHYALEVEGDSMVEAGIMDGDTVVIQRCEKADNGTVVVALLVDEKEVTLKRLRQRGNSIALEPANQKYETRIFHPDQVRIQGRLIGLIRQF